MTQFGIDFQLKVYTKTDSDSDMPISLESWRSEARKLLKDGPWGYIEGAAGSEDTMRENIRAFSRYRIRPRYLHDVDDRNQSITLFGKKYDSPFIIAPIGVQSIIHKDAEYASAGAAASLNMPYILSTVSSVSIEEIAKTYPDSDKWFQLYPGRDENVMKSMVKRAERSGYNAIVVTVDTTMLGWREQDLKNAYLPFLQGEGIANFLTDPEFLKRLDERPEDNMNAAIEEFLMVYVNPSFTWNGFKKIRQWTRLPVLVKGISSIEDANAAVSYGADGVIISNHGGRQVDGAISSLEALDEITQNGGINCTVLFDSGIRHGSDAMKALALGADGILIGRPYCYAMAVAGQRGIERYMNELKAELDLQMALSGFNSITELSRRMIYKKPY
ncbi:lactate 2-monooxygenase [Ferroplasma sp.]|uniref:lactate 2-monooxygenase n=1 Tax=Ferroplasma sp. TaxID=2591003 RepID=UPI00307E75DC